MQFFQTIADQFLDGIAMVRSDGVVTYANPALQSISGYGSRLIGMPIDDIPTSQTASDYVASARTQLATDGRWTGTIDLVRPDGTIWNAHIQVVPVTDPIAPEALWCLTVRDITAQHQMMQRLRLFETIVEDSPDGIALTTLAHPTLTYVNTMFAKLCGTTREEMLGQPISTYIDNVERDFPQVLAEVTARDRWEGMMTYRRKDGSTFPGMLAVFNTYDVQGQLATTVGIVRDISAQQAAEEERLVLQQQVIDAQQTALRELSTPLMPIADGLLIVPLIGHIDNRRAQDMTEALLEGIVAQQAHSVIIDITGVAVVDTAVADVLIRVSQAVQLLGARVILTGIRPEVAQTLVLLGINLKNIITQRTLQSGVAYVLR